jgi:hypothetical protein
MIKKFIDIDSSFRDRISYPSVGDFVIAMNGNPPANSVLSSIDPVILSFPFEASLTNGLSSTTQIALNVLSSTIGNYYAGKYLEINGEFRLITGYDPGTQFATVDTAFSAAPPAITPYTIRFELPILRGTTSAPSVSLNEIYLPITASSINNFYLNNYVFIPGVNPPDDYQWKRIISYDGTTKRAVVQGFFNNIIPLGETIELLRYSYDNVKNLKFFGTEIFNNPTCCTLGMVNLIVPNLPIIGSYGGTIQNYSHLYVALYSEKGITYNNPIISNSPVSDRALFKVPITFLQGISFLTLSYSGMAQKVSFRPNDTLHLSIFLPNGSILDFNNNSPFTYFDSSLVQFPIPSNPLSQIQAIFSVDFS